VLIRKRPLARENTSHDYGWFILWINKVVSEENAAFQKLHIWLKSQKCDAEHFEEMLCGLF
jgi:hypothetical protein